jgi:hypothetical protein
LRLPWPQSITPIPGDALKSSGSSRELSLVMPVLKIWP